MPDFPHRAWPAGEDYRYLEAVDRAGLAWEWLRRDPAYRRLTPGSRRRTAEGLVIDAAPPSCIARWGCLHIEDARQRATDTAIQWSAELDLSVLRVAAHSTSARDGSAFDLRRWASHAVIVAEAQGCEHLFLLGCPGVRLDVIAGTLLNGPVSLRFDMSLSDESERQLQTLRLFLDLCREGASAVPSVPAGRISRRSIDALRVHDALAESASIRDIGVMLFGAARIQAEWRAPGESLKSHCRRLIALSRFMADGGYKQLLR